MRIDSAGNVGIGSAIPGQKLTVEGTIGLLETGASPTFHTIFQGGDQTGNITYTLPPADGSNNYVLSTNGSGTLNWVAPTTTTPAFSSLGSGTNSAGTMTVGTGASLAVSGSGTITANQFTGSGSTSTAIDLATAEVAGTLPVARGGTNSPTALSNNRIMVSSGSAIVEAAALTNGQLLVGSGGAAPVAATLTGTTNQVNVTNGAGSITLSTPQSIHSGASPTFLGLTVSGLTDGVAHVSSGSISGGKVNLASSSDVSGTVGVGNGGTGATSLSGNGALIMNSGGTAATSLAAGSSGNILTSNGTTWTSQAPVATAWASPGTIGSTMPSTGAFTTLSSTGATNLATSGGSVAIGTTTASTKLDVVETGAAFPKGISSRQVSTNVNGANINLSKARGTPAAPTAVANGDNVGFLMASTYDGTSYLNPGSLGFIVNGTVATGSVPTDFTVSTGAASGGTERLRITSAGDVGIGTTAPGSMLDVRGGNGTSITVSPTGTNATSRLYVGSTDATPTLTKFSIRNVSAINNTNGLQSLDVENNAGSRIMTIADNGRVGIGTPSPSFHIDSQTDGLDSVVSTGYGGGNGGYFAGRSAYGTKSAPTATQASSAIAQFGGRGYGTTGFSTYSKGGLSILTAENWTDTAQGTSLSLFTTPTGSTVPADRLTVSANGNVGIGTPSALTRLANSGSLPVGSGYAMAPDGLFWRSLTGTSWAGAVISDPPSGQAFGLRVQSIGATSGDIPLMVTSGAGSGTLLLRVQGDGNVGIGSASPTAKLDVNGKIRGTATAAYYTTSGVTSTASTTEGNTSHSATIAVQNGDIVKAELACNGRNSASLSTYIRFRLTSGSATTLLDPNYINVASTTYAGGQSLGAFQATADGNLTFTGSLFVAGGNGYMTDCNFMAMIIGK